MKKKAATAEEKVNYKVMYPLHSWAIEDKTNLVCAIEDLRCWSKPDPQWEIVAPKGYIFRGYGTHSLLGQTAKDCIERADCHPLEKCDGMDGWCDCKEHWENT